MAETGDIVSLVITDMALPTALGVGRTGEFVVFVPGAVPGDRVRVRIAKREKRFGYGEIEEIEEASPDRRQARCPHSGECEGSDLQVLAYEKQLEIKQNHLRQLARRMGGPALAQVPILPIVPSVDEFFYRSKVEFSFGRTESGIVLGMTERVSPIHPFRGRIVAVDDCCLFSPHTRRILELMRDFIRTAGLPPFNKQTGNGVLKRLVLKEAKRTGEVMINVIATSDLREQMRPPADEIIRAIPEVKSIYVTREDRPLLLSGRPFIEEGVAGLVFRVYPLSFFQPNPKTAEELYKRIVSAAGISGNENVLGLYCGAGTIELFLAQYVRTVTGVDSSRHSISCAQENAAINGVENAVFIRGKAEAVAGQYRNKGIDVVVIDPPRSGVSPEALSAIRKVSPPRLVYVSCNPSTLMRDLVALGDEYAPKEMIPFDFFPQTAHFEVLTVLEKR